MISFSLDTGRLIASLDISASQVRYAVMLMINDIGKQSQEAVREAMDDTRGGSIHLRRATFELRQIYISRFATPRELTLVLEIKPDAKNLVRLAMGEDHDAWWPFNGKLYQWVPNSEVFQNKVISARNPLNQKLLQFSKRGNAFTGNQDTFVINHPPKHPDMPQVWQRVASGSKGSRQSRAKGTINKKKVRSEASKNTRMLYTLVDKQRTPLKLEFYGPVRRTIGANLVETLKRALFAAIQPKPKK